MSVACTICISKGITIVPLQVTGDGEVTVGVIALPQASVTAGGVGATASLGQLTVEEPLTGRVKSGAAIV
jgi:hypothetical protein